MLKKLEPVHKIRLSAIVAIISAVLVMLLLSNTQAQTIVTPTPQAHAYLPYVSGYGSVSFADRPLLGLTVNGCGDLEPGEEAGVIAAHAAQGSDFYAFRVQWDALQDPNTLELMQWAIPWAHDLGYEVMLTIPTIDTAIRTIPPHLSELSMDDPQVLAAFDDVLETFLTTEVVSSLAYIAFGNEVDLYLNGNLHEVDPFVVFANHAYAKLDELGGGSQIRRCVTFSHVGLADDSNDVVRRLLPHCDYLPVTYYPMDDSGAFQFNDPGVVASDFAIVDAWAGQLPIVYQEIGYVSAAVNGGSESRQAEFLSNAILTAARNEQVQVLNIDWYCDMPRAECEELAQNLYNYEPGMPGYEEFIGFLCSLGLKHQDGAPKAAYSVFLQAIAALDQE